MAGRILRGSGRQADQKRTVTPRRALADGASVLVIGRPITGAADPARAIMDIAASLPQTPVEARSQA
jgi:orotidine-5'-phosphate decarboxylase